jgi:hypothetical protein
MKKLILFFSLIFSYSLHSQSYNLDHNFNSKPFDRTWEVTMNIIENQVFFNWEKDIVTSIVIKSTDDNIFFPKIDAYMTSQLTLNNLNSGNYKIIFLDDCNAIMDEKQFQIK